jgi:hypothetical protein
MNVIIIKCLPFIEKNNIIYDFFICIRSDNIYFKNCINTKISAWNTNNINVRMRLYQTKLNLLYHTVYLGNDPEIVDYQFFIIPNKIAHFAFSIKKGNYSVLSTNKWNE